MAPDLCSQSIIPANTYAYVDTKKLSQSRSLGAHLDYSGMTALHEGVYGKVVHAVLSDYLSGGLVRLEGVQQHQRHICNSKQKKVRAIAIAFRR